MKVKASINKSEFEPCSRENIIRFDAVFATEKGVKVDFKNFQNIEFDVPIINELEKYSIEELKEELLRREKEFSKSFIFCCRCKEPIYTKQVTCRFKQVWYYCEHCNENVLARKLPE